MVDPRDLVGKKLILQMTNKTFLSFILLCASAYSILLSAQTTTDRIPFYEDFVEDGNLNDYLKLANQFLDENSDAPEAPRVALDLLMMGKAAEDLKSVIRGTDLLLFDYLGSLPSLHFLSTFEPRSKRLTELLKVKTEEANLNDADFSQAFADAISLLARLHGPQLMENPDLRIRSYLITLASENKNLNESLKEALEQLLLTNDPSVPVTKVVLSDLPAQEKLRNLAEMGGKEADFCMEYYLAQLSEEQRNSKEILEIVVEWRLFSSTPSPKDAVELLKDLPQSTNTNPKLSLYHAYGLLMDEKKDAAMQKLLRLIDENEESSSEWTKIAKSLAEGMEFSESRKNLLLQQLEAAYDRLMEERDAVLLEASWQLEKNETVTPLLVHLGASQSKEFFEIQIRKDKEPIFCYRTDNNSSALLSPNGMNYDFPGRGAYPLPSFNIFRDADEGTFNYNFNLNFGKEFSDLKKEVGKFLDNSYAGTSKGREVLLNYLMERKGVWIAPPISLDNGTRFTLRSISPKISETTKSVIETDLSGNLNKIRINSLSLERIVRGDPSILESMPKWPETENTTSPSNFDLEVLLQAISQLLAL